MITAELLNISELDALLVNAMIIAGMVLIVGLALIFRD